MAAFGKIIVVGGGIGGCTAALALQRAGCDVEIFEAAPEFKEIGAGINITSAAAAVLLSLGLEETLRCPEIGDGIESSVRHYYSPEGILLAEEPLGLEAGEPAPQFSVHRAKLHNALIDMCRRRLGPQRMHLDHVFTSLQQDDDGVTVRFQRLLPPHAEHAPVRGSFLIGCDGLKSPVREQLYGEVQPRYTGWTIYRGLTELPFPVLDGKSIVLTGGCGATFIAYPVSDNARKAGKTHCNWAYAQLQPGPEKGESWTNQSSVEDIRESLKAFKVRLGKFTPLEIAERTDGIIGWALFDRDPISRWAFGRVALLGDSAHPLLPFGSQGGTQAMLDAQALAEAFAAAAAKGEAGQAVLRSYEAVRAAPAAKVVLANRAMGPTKVLRVFEESCAGMLESQKRDWVAKNVGMLSDLVQGYRKEIMNAHRQVAQPKL